MLDLEVELRQPRLPSDLVENCCTRSLAEVGDNKVEIRYTLTGYSGLDTARKSWAT
jgi:hypothetical protein